MKNFILPIDLQLNVLYNVYNNREREEFGHVQV